MRHEIMFCISRKLSTSTGSALLARRSLPRSKCPSCRQLSTTRRHASSRLTPDLNSPFSGSYDPSANTGRGPMFSKSSFGVPRFYPRDLKDRVDDYVVGQDRAKKAICATIFNHYQNVRRRRQHEHDERNRKEKIMRQRLSRDREFHQRRRETHPVEDEFPGHFESLRPVHDPPEAEEDPFDSLYAHDDQKGPDPVKIDKSNILLIGPTGVGKTYILETLSKKINVPFSICDCNSFTQAGYIGQDVESCIERLLIEANYDIKAAEQGIVVLDEFDKIARREVHTGRDVSGEGVQQALLMLVEGTKVTVNVKDNRSSRSAPPITTNFNSSGSSSSAAQTNPPGGKVDQYIIDTTNILFVFCGAFVGLDKTILKRVAKPSVGFGGKLEGRMAMSGGHQQLASKLYAHLPYFSSVPASSFTPLDLATPDDLQAFGFIPELIGRLHNICALSPLSKDDLFRILTEPRNNLAAQYIALFETYPSCLYFTDKALYAIAERASASGTGARGLKMEMERVLAEPMFEAPTPYVLITEACVNGNEKAATWGREGRFEFDRRTREEKIKHLEAQPEMTFEQYREAGESGG